MIDTLINARWILPVAPEFKILENYSLAIDHGRIVDVLPIDEAAEKYSARHIIERPNHVVLPGLINAHTHIAMSLFRGLADDMPLMTWLNDYIWPAEASQVNPDFIRLGTQLGIAEMLKSGTTCFQDMYFYPDVVAHTASDLGMRATVGMIVIDFPSAWAADANEYFEKGLQVADDYKTDPLISTVFAPHAPYTVNDENFKRVVATANELEKPIHIHLHETEFEVSESIEKTGLRPLQRMEELGALSPDLIAVHMTQLTDKEIQTLAINGVNVVHCPESNMKLASGFCPVDKLIKAGINVALGTDGAASNNDHDMLGEMRSAAMIAKCVAQDATAVDAKTAIEMATINGAKALGLADEIGSLEVDKWADICCIDLSPLNTQPVHNPVSQIVYSANASQVSDVWVAGKHLLNQKKLTNLDEASLTTEIQNWHANFVKTQ